MNKIVYITAKTPFGLQESFVLTEMVALKEAGADLLIIPRDKSNDNFVHEKARPLLATAIVKPLIDFSIVSHCLRFFFHRPLSFFKIIYRISFKARNINVAFKNLAIFPKSVYFSGVLSKMPVEHIHAHWASTTSTMAYIISLITDIPWSFTAHRWDIPENNLLKEKCKTASFARAIDENGRQEIYEIIDDTTLKEKIKVIHMGVSMPEPRKKSETRPEIVTIICPANFVPKKGHRYLFEACKLLIEKNIKIRCLIAGDGPLEHELKNVVKNLGIDSNVEFLGRLPHERLFELYSKGGIDAVVLPSIITGHDDKEGIPVSLMEAMSYGIPVISTDTGGIAELLGDGCGIMVEEKNPKAIAIAIERLIADETYYEFINKRAREKIRYDFNVFTIREDLINLFLGARCG